VANRLATVPAVPSAILQALYEGRRADAVAAAGDADLDVLEAAALGDEPALRALLQADPSLAALWSDDGFTALHYACFFGTAAAVAALVEAGADVEAPSRNDMGVRPLNSAAAGPEPAASAAVLLEAGADPDGRQSSGHTALDEARIRADEALEHVLLAAGASDPASQ
jgi:ankyrin repeat protein